MSQLDRANEPPGTVGMGRADRGAAEMAGAATAGWASTATGTWAGQSQPQHLQPWVQGYSAATQPQPWGLNGHFPPGHTSMMQSLAAQQAEAELQRRTAQVLALSRQVEATQAELRVLRCQAANPIGTPQALVGVRADQARQFVASVRPELEAAKDKLGKTMKVAKNLNAWFVENAVKMNIQDPSATPSAFLEQLLERSDNRMEQLSADVVRIDGALEAAVLQSAAGVQQGAPLQAGAVVIAADSQSRVQPLVQAVAAQGSLPGVQTQSIAGLDQSCYLATHHVAQPVIAASGAPCMQAQAAMPASLAPRPVASGNRTLGPAQADWGLPMGMWVRDPDAA